MIVGRASGRRLTVWLVTAAIAVGGARCAAGISSVAGSGAVTGEGQGAGDGERRLVAVPSALRSAADHPPALACDGNASTAWLADAKPAAANNEVWFQLDAGAVRRLGRLHWEAAREPYPAAGPMRYSVAISDDAQHWRAIPVAPNRFETAIGDIALGTRGRYVRLRVDQVRDGSGWALGLREIWISEGSAPAVAAATMRPRLSAGDGSIALAWTLPTGYLLDRIRVLAGRTPAALVPIALLPGQAVRYEEQSLASFTPRYYALEGLDAKGAPLLRTPPAAGFARSRAVAPLPETVAFWYQGYVAHDQPGATVTVAGDTPLVIGPDAHTAAADLRPLGRSLLPYVTYYQTSSWTARFGLDAAPERVRRELAPVAFFRPELAFPNAPAGFLPSQFSRPEHIEFNRDFIQYTTCPNSVPFRQLALAHVEQQLADGAAGLFVDNGYRDEVAAGQSCESPLHAHAIAPSPTGAQSFLALLVEVYTTIKRRRPDGWLIVNSGVPDGTDYDGLALSDVSDAQLWESYLRSSRNREPEHRSDWATTHAQSIDLERRAVRTITLSYPWNRDEAFFCYATAKLSQLPWAASLGDRDALHRRNEGFFGTYPELIGARLGAALRDEPGGVPMGAVWVRELEHGLVVVNPTSSFQEVAAKFTRPHRYRELFSRRDAEGAGFSAQLPPESGRVLIWR